MRTAMVTNGFLIPEKFDTVRKMDEIVISIDGAEEAHDRQRGPGAWTKVMRGIDLCAKEGLDFFLSAVVTRHSADQIPWLLETASRLGIMVNFQIPQFNEEMYGAEARAWMPDPGDIRRIVAEIIAAKENGAPVLFTTRSYRRTLAWPDFALERVERPGKRSPCTAGRYFLQMEPNGDVYPCVLHIGTFRPLQRRARRRRESLAPRRGALLLPLLQHLAQRKPRDFRPEPGRARKLLEQLSERPRELAPPGLRPRP